MLLIAPQDQQAWLVGPDHEAARDGVPMCASHADRVTVPFGWQLRDDRPTERPRARRKPRARKPASDAPPTSEPVAQAPPQSATSPRRSAAPEPLAAPEAEAQLLPDAEAVTDAAAPVTEPVESAVAGSGATAPAEPDTAVAGTLASTPLDADPPASPETASGAEPSRPERTRSPADVPAHADEVAAAVVGSGARLTVVPGDDDPSKTFAIEPDGQTALWAEIQRDEHEPSDETPLLKRAFRVVRED